MKNLEPVFHRWEVGKIGPVLLPKSNGKPPYGGFPFFLERAFLPFEAFQMVFQRQIDIAGDGTILFFRT